MSWDEEFPALLGLALLNKRRSRKDKAKFVDIFKLFFEFVKGINGEAGRCNADLAAFANGQTEIVYDLVVDIIKKRQVYVWRFHLSVCWVLTCCNSQI